MSKRILGIETSCDETAAAVVEGGTTILSNVIHSQVALHRLNGGVIPEVACASHIEQLSAVVHQALQEANTSLTDLDAIAVTQGPGLIGALLIGVNFAKALAWRCHLPLIPVNHIKAHLYAAFMEGQAPQFPLLGLVLSGGHTFMALMEDFSRYTIIGQTVDDAIGEAFDKAARLLGLPYPGGPELEKLAQKGDPKAFKFRAGQVKGRPLDFSFSGIKTSLLYAIKAAGQLTETVIQDLAASFQQALFDDLLKKVGKALVQFQCDTLAIGGGVTANLALRRCLGTLPCQLRFPPAGLSLDNGAMIAGMAAHLPALNKEEQLLFEPIASQYRLTL